MIGFRTYLTAAGGVLVGLGGAVAAAQSGDWHSFFMSLSATLISLAQIYQRSATERASIENTTQPME